MCVCVRARVSSKIAGSFFAVCVFTLRYETIESPIPGHARRAGVYWFFEKTPAFIDSRDQCVSRCDVLEVKKEISHYRLEAGGGSDSNANEAGVGLSTENRK